MSLPRLFLLFLTSCLLYACTPEQLASGRQAEQAYVDLFYAIHTEEPTAAKTAARQLDKTLVQLRTTWQRPLSEERAENIRYHLDQAAWVYAEARESIEAANLELAGIQLDRATYELTAASPATMHELYIGAIYDFLITWVEVKHAVGEPDLCSLEWTGFSNYAKDVRNTWRRVRSIMPHDRMYGPEAPIDMERFELAHASVEVALEKFEAILQTGDQCLAAEKAEQVSAAIWDLVLLFSSEPTGSI
ncbi:hypothetical protein [Neolewinella persica]|uniref:hypothetical protein n=1 Tax=Neolewinella persica TaxID=70998 RepID=UPI00036FA6CB|nr:hypothetical protein [Neolewinella persica]